MDPGAIGALVGIVGAACAFLGWLLPSPRDQQKAAQLMRDEALKLQADRLTAVESDHRKLEREYIQSNAELRAAVNNLTVNVSTLNVTIRELTKQVEQRSHGNP